MDFLAQPTHLLFLLIIVLLFFGTSRLPRLARSLREARDEFTKGSDDKPADPPAGTQAPAGTQPPAAAPPADETPPGPA